MNMLTEAVIGKSACTWYGNQIMEMAKMEFQLSRVDVAEIYSPARVTELCSRFNLQRGMAMDLKSGYDFDKEEDRNKAWAMLEEDKPMLVIGSPPCTFFSTLQYLNMHLHKDDVEWTRKFKENLEKAKRHVEFGFNIYQYQREQGRFFLHEHPWLAGSWKMECVSSMEMQPDVMKVRTDMCQFGMVSHVESGSQELGPVLKPTGFLTNCEYIEKELSRRCDTSHKHVQLMGGRAAAVAIYPEGLCEAICRGLAAQKRQERLNIISSLPMSSKTLSSFSTLCHDASIFVEGENEAKYESRRQNWKKRWAEDMVKPNGNWPDRWCDPVHEPTGRSIEGENGSKVGEEKLIEAMNALIESYGNLIAYDDVTSAVLDPALVAAAREVEMELFREMSVYTSIPRSEMLAKGGKTIKTRWIDVNKGDTEKTNYRSRLVGK